MIIKPTCIIAEFTAALVNICSKSAGTSCNAAGIELRDFLLLFFFWTAMSRGNQKNVTWDPFLEAPGNLTGPKSYFEIKLSRKVGWVLTSNEVHFVSLADDFTVQFSNLLKLPSGMENNQLNGHGNYRELRETGPWFKAKKARKYPVWWRIYLTEDRQLARQEFVLHSGSSLVLDQQAPEEESRRSTKGQT